MVLGAGSNAQKKNSKSNSARTANKDIIAYEHYTSKYNDTIGTDFSKKINKKITEIGPKRKQVVAIFGGMMVMLDLNEPYETVLTSEFDIISALAFQNRRSEGMIT